MADVIEGLSPTQNRRSALVTEAGHLLTRQGAKGQVGSAALEASHIIKASPGRLVSLVVYNDKSSAQYIQVHDSATLPADAAVPLFTFQVATKATFVLPVELDCATGIVVCNSSTGPAKTIGTTDCWFLAKFD